MLPVNKRYVAPVVPGELPKLSSSRLRFLERNSFLDVTDKVRLLAILARKRWVTDLAFCYGKLDDNKMSEYSKILDNLGLAYEINSYEHSRKGMIYWLQVAANRQLLAYVMDRRDSLSVLEAGVLYGYPVSHCLAFMNILDHAKKRSRSLDDLFLAGIYSKDCYEDEREYFEEVWRSLEGFSASIISAARASASHDQPHVSMPAILSPAPA